MWDLALNKSEIWPSFTPIIVYFMVLAQSRSWVKDTGDQKNEEQGTRAGRPGYLGSFAIKDGCVDLANLICDAYGTRRWRLIFTAWHSILLWKVDSCWVACMVVKGGGCGAVFVAYQHQSDDTLLFIGRLDENQCNTYLVEPRLVNDVYIFFLLAKTIIDVFLKEMIHSAVKGVHATHSPGLKRPEYRPWMGLSRLRSRRCWAKRFPASLHVASST